ncbi:MAG: hypothetical protein FJ390_05160 [Verrucomicrobia bacterium]|nr:hypothetical protein [Verrucomicrobiota bacterium]
MINHAQEYTRTPLQYARQVSENALELGGSAAGFALGTGAGIGLGAAVGAAGFHAMSFLCSAIPAASAFAAITTAHVWGPVVGIIAGTAIALPLAINAARMHSSILFSAHSAINRWITGNNIPIEPPQLSRLDRGIAQGAAIGIGGFSSYFALSRSVDPAIIAANGMHFYTTLAPLITLGGGLVGALSAMVPAYRLSYSYFSPSTAWEKLKQTIHYWRGNGIGEALPRVQGYSQNIIEPIIQNYRAEVALDQRMPDSRNLQRTPQQIRSIIADFFEKKQRELQNLITALENRMEEIESRVRRDVPNAEAQE